MTNITSPSQIKDLPWKVDFHSNAPLFQVVHDYIVDETTSKEDKKLALFEMGKYGMGYDEEPVTDDELDDYMRESGMSPKST